MLKLSWLSFFYYLGLRNIKKIPDLTLRLENIFGCLFIGQSDLSQASVFAIA